MLERTSKPKIMGIALALILCGAATAAAQSIPPLINYQGRLTGADGQPLATGEYTLEFRIWSDPTSVDEATHLVWGPQLFDGGVGGGHGAMVPVVQGYFNVMLGPVDTQGPVLRSIVDAFTGELRYIEIRVNGGPAILPRQQILSAPYAVQASYLGDKKVALDEATGAVVVDAPVELRAADTSAQIKLERTGTSPGYGYIGSDETNAFRVFSNSLAPILYVGHNGNVGVGVAPDHRLHVNGNLQVDGNTTTTGQVNAGALSAGTVTATVRFQLPKSATKPFDCVSSTVGSLYLDTNVGGWQFPCMCYRNGPSSYYWVRMDDIGGACD